MTDITILCFLTVCETLNFTKAAEQLHMSQQGVSRQVQSLEKELGYQLLRREYHSITPTEIGQHYQRLFSKWCRELDEANHIAYQIATTALNRIRVGYLPRLTLHPRLEKIFFRFKADHPACVIEYKQIDATDIIKLVADGTIDFAYAHEELAQEHVQLCRVNIAQSQQFISVAKRLLTEPPQADALSRMDYLYVIMEDKTSEQEIQRASHYLNEIGVHPRSYREVSDDDMLHLSVKMGEGITITSTGTKLYQDPSIASIPLNFTSYLTIFWNERNPNPLVRELGTAFQHLLPEPPSLAV